MPDKYYISDGYELHAMHEMHNGVFDKRIGNLSFVQLDSSLNYPPYKFKRCTFDNVVFTQGDLSNAVFHVCTFNPNCVFDEVIAKHSSFNQCVFHQTSFIKANLTESNATQNRFYDVDFSNASADRATFDDSRFKNGIFKEASLISSSFSGCDLTNARFFKAKAPGSNFTMAINPAIV